MSVFYEKLRGPIEPENITPRQKEIAEQTKVCLQEMLQDSSFREKVFILKVVVIDTQDVNGQDVGYFEVKVKDGDVTLLSRFYYNSKSEPVDPKLEHVSMEFEPKQFKLDVLAVVDRNFEQDQKRLNQ